MTFTHWNVIETYPPNKAIFKFFLNTGHSSQAANPPGIDASFHIFSSVSALDDIKFSLETKNGN